MPFRRSITPGNKDNMDLGIASSHNIMVSSSTIEDGNRDSSLEEKEDVYMQLPNY